MKAVEYNGRYQVIEFQVVDADVIPVLGMQTATDLQLIQRLYTSLLSVIVRVSIVLKRTVVGDND